MDERVNDATSKVELLNGEVAFSDSLRAILERLQAIQKTLDLIQRYTLDGRLLEAVDLLGQVFEDLSALSFTKSARITGVLGAKVTDLRDHVVEKLTAYWKAYINVDPANSTIRITQMDEGAKSI